MSDFDWEKGRDKLKTFFDEGLHYLREGAVEAQHITEATIDRLKTELEVKRLITHVNHLKVILGSETLKLFDKVPALKSNKIIARLIQEINLGERQLKSKQKNIDKMSIVKKSKARPGKKKKAAKKKKKKVSKKS